MTAISRRQASRRLYQCLVASVLGFYLVALALGFAVVQSAVAADESLASRCAARDLQIVTALETRDADLVPREELRAETFVLQEARRLCTLNLVPEALAVYDRVLFNSKPISAASVN